MAALFAAEHVARATEFEVERGNLEACTEIAELLERREPATGDFCQLGLRRDEQVGVSASI